MNRLTAIVHENDDNDKATDIIRLVNESKDEGIGNLLHKINNFLQPLSGSTSMMGMKIEPHHKDILSEEYQDLENAVYGQIAGLTEGKEYGLNKVEKALADFKIIVDYVAKNNPDQDFSNMYEVFEKFSEVAQNPKKYMEELDMQEGGKSKVTASDGVKILIVDDERVIPEMLTQFIADSMGSCYPTDTACNGDEGWTMLSAHPDRYIALITDINMPGGMNGYELAAKAKGLNPELRVAMITGYLNNYPPENVDLFLRKPFDLEKDVRPFVESLR